MPGRRVGRITTRAAFADLQRARARGASGPVRVVFAPAPAAEPGVFPQVGYAIGRGCGTAVTRNSLRRRARAVAHAEAPDLPKGRFLVRLDPTAASLPAARFRAHVSRALRRAAGTREES